MNAVMKNLEDGKSRVKGLKMLYPIDSTGLFRVTVDGVSFDAGKMTVRVVPVDGTGHIYVRPDELVDDNLKSRDLYKRQCAAKEFVRKYRGHGGAWLRAEVTKILVGLTKAQQESALGEFVKIKPSRLSEYDCKRVLGRIAQIKFKLDEEVDD